MAGEQYMGMGEYFTATDYIYLLKYLSVYATTDEEKKYLSSVADMIRKNNPNVPSKNDALPKEIFDKFKQNPKEVSALLTTIKTKYGLGDEFYTKIAEIVPKLGTFGKAEGAVAVGAGGGWQDAGVNRQKAKGAVAVQETAKSKTEIPKVPNATITPEATKMAMGGTPKQETSTTTTTSQPAIPSSYRWIRELLYDKNVKDEDIGWDNEKKQVLVKGKPLNLDRNKIKIVNGKLYIDPKDFEAVWNTITGEADVADATGGETGNVGGTVAPEETGNVDGTVAPENPYKDMTFAEIDLEMNKIKYKYDLQNLDDYEKMVYEYYHGNADKGELGLLGQIAETYDSLIKSSRETLQNALKNSVAVLEANKGNMDKYAVMQKEEIDKSVAAAEQRSNANMVARGIYFSGLTTRALNQIEAQGVSEKNKVDMEVLKYKANIDMQIATLTAQYELKGAELENMYMAQKALRTLECLTQEKQELMTIKKMRMGLENEIKILEEQLPLKNELERRAKEQADAEAQFKYLTEVTIPMMELDLKQQKIDLDKEALFYQVQHWTDQLQLDWAKYGLNKAEFIANQYLELGKMFDIPFNDLVQMLEGQGIYLKNYPRLSSKYGSGSSGGGSSSDNPDLLIPENISKVLSGDKAYENIKTQIQNTEPNSLARKFWEAVDILAQGYDIKEKGVLNTVNLLKDIFRYSQDGGLGVLYLLNKKFGHGISDLAILYGIATMVKGDTTPTQLFGLLTKKESQTTILTMLKSLGFDVTLEDVQSVANIIVAQVDPRVPKNATAFKDALMSAFPELYGGL